SDTGCFQPRFFYGYFLIRLVLRVPEAPNEWHPGQQVYCYGPGISGLSHDRFRIDPSSKLSETRTALCCGASHASRFLRPSVISINLIPSDDTLGDSQCRPSLPYATSFV